MIVLTLAAAVVWYAFLFAKLKKSKIMGPVPLLEVLKSTEAGLLRDLRGEILKSASGHSARLIEINERLEEIDAPTAEEVG
ncbi:MAG: hypothetical protein QXG10_03210 [Candidatus Hadarchaeales archaeon]